MKSKMKKMFLFFLHKVESIKEKIPNIISLIFIVPNIKKTLINNEIKQVKNFKFKYWHFGYKYFTGILNDKKVFIKYNTNSYIIKNEYKNNEYINKNSKFLKQRLPKIYFSKKLKKGSLICEEFINATTIKEVAKKGSQKEKIRCIEEFNNILNEFQKIGFLHLDLNPTNLYYQSNKVIIIDVGFSLTIDSKNFDYIKNKRKRKFVETHLNEFSRLEKKYIDDAISFLNISMILDPELINNNYIYWKNFNILSNKLYYDKGVVNNEN